MNTSIVHKVPRGKMLKIEADIEDSVIKDIRITGDFFIHPEEAITKIEGSLKDKTIHEVEKHLSEFLDKENIRVIGFDPKDLQEALAGDFMHT